jgi:hypothetical protein
MNNLTIVTKLRFMSILAPIILLLIGAAIVWAIHLLGNTPVEIYQNEYAAVRAAQSMENAVYKMDWGRTQPDASEIVMDQQRGFIAAIELARQHITTRDQAESVEKIANTARPLFDALRSAAPGDDSLEPKLRKLQGMVADLMAADDAALQAVAAGTESLARTMIVIAIVGTVVVPWICFVVVASLTGSLYTQLKEMRRRLEAIADHASSAPEDIKVLDASLAALGFPKPNPMLAE